MSVETNPSAGAKAPSSTTTEESAEIKEARKKATELSYERNRAEAIYNKAKKEHGEKSPEALAAKKALDKAQAAVDKAQAELRQALKLQSQSAKGGNEAKGDGGKPAAKEKPKTDGPAPLSGEAPPPPKPSKAEAPKAEKPSQTPPKPVPTETQPKAFLYELESIEIFKVPSKESRERLEKILKDLKIEPKTLEHFRKQLNRGEMQRRLELPHGEMLKIYGR